MSQFNNGNVNIAGGCGVNSVPAVGVYNLSPQCPSTGFGANSFASQTQALKFGLTPPVPFLTLASSSTEQILVFGPLDCGGAFVARQLGVPEESLVEAFDVATLNNAAFALQAFTCSNVAVTGMIINTTTDLSGLTGVQIIADPCSACYAGDVQFQTASNCNGSCSFVASNIPIGGSNWFALRLPAFVGATIQICDCVIETPSFSGCPTAVPVVANVPAGSYCPPSYVDAPVLTNGNGAAVYSGQRRF